MMRHCSIITPSHYCNEGEIKKAKKNLEKIGFSKILDFTSKERFFGRWAESPKKRLELFEKAWNSEPEIIFACRGGSGISHFISDINFSQLKKNKKTLVGYSDITPLLNLIHQKLKIVSLHGPMTLKNLDGKSLEALRNALQMKNYGIKFSKDQVLNLPNSSMLNGTIMGGNLERIKDLLSYTSSVNLRNKIVFLEEVGESEYRIFNHLSFLKQSKLFKPKALLIGDLNIKNKSLIIKMLEYLFPDIPMIVGLPFGHKLPNITIPIGVKTKINFEEGKISFVF